MQLLSVLMDVGSQAKEGEGLIVLCGGQIEPESHFGFKEQKLNWKGKVLAHLIGRFK